MKPHLRNLAVLRPEPGNAATCARIAVAGATALALPLFAVRPLDWTPPPAERFDAMVLTSANAVRHGGAALAAYQGLPVFAVGEATAAAARAAGFTVTATGDGDARDLARLVSDHGVRAGLHLAGRDRVRVDLPGVRETIAVYASEATEVAPDALARLADTVALVHSPRAGRRLAALAPDRATTRVAAISAAALAAGGPGWAAATVAAHPDDDALIAAALTLAARPAD